MKQNLILAGIVVVLIGAIAGGYFYPNLVAVGSPAGTTFNTAKVGQINISPQSITSTSTSLYNGDASDRIVTDAFISCSGLGVAYSSTGGADAWHWYAATSSTAAPTATVANALLAAMNVTIATSTGYGYTATSTYTNTYSRIWNAGSYMVFQTNATTSSAACTTGVHYLAS